MAGPSRKVTVLLLNLEAVRVCCCLCGAVLCSVFHQGAEKTWCRQIAMGKTCALAIAQEKSRKLLRYFTFKCVLC